MPGLGVAEEAGDAEGDGGHEAAAFVGVAIEQVGVGVEIGHAAGAASALKSSLEVTVLEPAQGGGADPGEVVTNPIDPGGRGGHALTGRSSRLARAS